MSIFKSMLGFLGNTTRALYGLNENDGEKDGSGNKSKSPEGRKLNAFVREETRKTAKKLLEKFDKETINNFVSGKTKGSEKESASNKNKDVKSKNNTASKIKPLPQGGDMIDMLNKIYSFLKTNSEEDKLHQERLNNYMEENLAEAKARHDKLLEAIKKLTKDIGYGKEVPAPTAVKDVPPEQEKSILDYILDAFDIGKGALDLAKKVGKVIRLAGPLLLNPITLTFLAGIATLGIARYLVGQIAENAPNMKAMSPNEAAAALTGSAGDIKKQGGREFLEDIVKNGKARAIELLKDPVANAEAIKQMGGLDKVKAIANDEKEYTVPDKVNTEMPEVKRREITPGSLRDRQRQNQQGDTASPAPADAAPSPGAKLNNAVSENNNAKIEQMTEAPEVNTVNNTMVSGNKKESEIAPKLDLPSVRNQEETFRRMIFYSTKVV